MERNWIEESRVLYISDEVLEYLNLSLTISIHGVLAVFGVVSNAVSMVVFVQLRLRSSMSVGLFVLSFTDLWVTAFQLASCCAYLVKVVYPECPVDPWTLGGYMFSWAHYVAYLISCWITTYLSVERCFCVVYPFAVRRTFTKTRCVWFVIIIYTIHIGVHIPMFVYAELKWISVASGLNSTASEISILKVVLNDNSAMWVTLSDIVAGMSLSFLSQVILIVCTLFMIASLKSSSRIRQNSEDFGKVTNANGNRALNLAEDCLSPREKRMAKTVLCLAVIVTVCNVPRFVTTAVHHIVPGMNVGAMQNLQIFLWDLSYIFGTACCSCNLFVYLKLNSSYRQSFLHMFAIKQSWLV